MKPDLHFSSVIQEEYEKIHAKNPQYSLRSFAKKIGVSSSTLTTLLQKKSGLSITKAKQIATKLKLETEEAEYFFTLVQMSCAKKKEDRETARIYLRKFNLQRNKMSLDSFKIVADWFHFAIVELTHLKNFQSDAAWISKKLRITEKEAEEAIERLLRVGLLEKKSGNIVATKDFYFVPSGTPAESGREFHRQLMKKAAAALTEQPMKERCFGSSILRVNQADLPALKKRFHDFRRELGAWLESTENPDSIYAVSLQAFRLDHSSRDE